MNRNRGQAAVFLLILLAMVLLGTLALSLDVGRMYVIKSELQAAADAAALAAGTQLIGATNSTDNADATRIATMDPGVNGTDNRFNLRLNSLSDPTSVVNPITFAYFSAPDDARAGTGGADQTGQQAKYVRVDIEVQSPSFFTRFLSGTTDPPRVHAFAVAGMGGPLCTVCGVDSIAVTAIDASDDQDYGFVPGEYYTLYRAGCPTVPLLTATLQPVAYTILNHAPVGPDTNTDGVLFRLGGGGISPRGTEELPGCVTVGALEGVRPELQGLTCAQAQPIARNFVCGLNTRFGVPPTGTICGNIENVDLLTPLFTADSDIGTTTLQDYQQDYAGNARRVLTVPIVTDTATLTVANFRQFLVENAATVSGLAVNDARGAFRAQYIGVPVPVRVGNTAACPPGGISRGVGKVVLF